jgi:hypothetical protein
MAAQSPEDVWKIRNERVATFTPHDKWSRRIADIGGASTIKNPCDICESVWFLFGPAAALRSVSQNLADTFPDWVEASLSRFEYAGVIPRHRQSPSTFALVTVPAWSAWYGKENADAMSEAAVAARPRWADNVTVEDRRANQDRDIWDLVNIKVHLRDLHEKVFAVPGLNGIRKFYSGDFWKFLRNIVRDIEVPSPQDSPTIDGFFFATLDAAKPKDERPKYITVVNNIYSKMTPSQQTILNEQMIGDHIFMHPPSSKSYKRSPHTIPERVCVERQRWLKTTYGLFVYQFVVYTLNVAHLIYLEAFFPKHPVMCRKFQRIRTKMIDLFMAEHETRIHGLLDDLYADLVSPSLAYTRPICVEEIYGWLLHAFELEYVRDITRKQRAGVSRSYSAELCRAYNSNALSMEDIVATLVSNNIQLSEQWLNTVLDDWGDLHGSDYVLSDNHDTRDDAPAAWLRRFKSQLREQRLIGTDQPPLSINLHLKHIMEISVVRYFIFCFHEKHSNELTQGRAKRVLASFEEHRLALSYLSRHPDRAASSLVSYEGLTRFVGKILIPCINWASNPMKLINMMDGNFLVWPDPSGDLSMRPPADIGVADAYPADTSLEDAAKNHKDIEYAWQNDGHVSDIFRLLDYAIRQYHASITSYNWYERFYERWAIPNLSSDAGGITYAARLDDLETQAHNHYLSTRGFIHTTDVKFTAEEFESSVIHFAVNEWPRYKQWKNVVVTWRAHVQGNTSPGDDFIYGYSVKGRVFYPVELACSILLEKLRCKRNVAKHRVAEIVIECNVNGLYEISTRVPRVYDRLNTSKSCIVTISNF